MNQFVIDINADDFDRSRNSACIYCGDTTSLTRDHVVAVSWSGYKRSYRKGDTVPSCKECNQILSNKPLFSISSRANYLANKLTRKYQSILNHPHWDDEELKEMSCEFQKTLKNRGNAKSFISARIRHASLTALDENTLKSIKQNTHDDNTKYRILDFLYSGNNYQDASMKFQLSIEELKSMFRKKSNFQILTYFKWDNKIPFEKPIYKAIRERQEAKKAREPSKHTKNKNLLNHA